MSFLSNLIILLLVFQFISPETTNIIANNCGTILDDEPSELSECSKLKLSESKCCMFTYKLNGVESNVCRRLDASVEKKNVDKEGKKILEELNSEVEYISGVCSQRIINKAMSLFIICLIFIAF